MSAVSLLFHDEDLMAVNKPPGWLSVPGRTAEKQECLFGWLRRWFPELLVVHRLDRDTSGIILFARNRQTQTGLGRMFAHGQIRKDYIAWVTGQLRPDSGTVDRPVGRVAPGGLPPRYQVDQCRGKPAQTRWKVLGRQAERTRVWLRPLTGRSHQLRVHCQCLGHPIVGDPIYGSDCGDRMLLHACRLRFPHPRDGVMLKLKAPIPF
jgi:tRNA pseudouridine32 synthase/23S rRNA pseudouridine746 synthase